MALPSASLRSLPDPATAACDLCELRYAEPLRHLLVIDGPDGLPVPFLICDPCQRALAALHDLLRSASNASSPELPAATPPSAGCRSSVASTGSTVRDATSTMRNRHTMPFWPAMLETYASRVESGDHAIWIWARPVGTLRNGSV